MELWIRNQTKKSLIKVDNIQVSNIQLSLMDTYHFITTDNNGVTTILGTYETEERAKEILNEIQDLLQNAYVGSVNRIVYQMPEN